MTKRPNSHGHFSRRRLIGVAAAAASQAIVPVSTRATTQQQPSIGSGGLDLERFVEDCITANGANDAQAAVKEVLAEAVYSPNAALAAVGEPVKAGINVLHRSRSLTIFNATWTPQMNLMPHNHLMWALIGIYTGREDNIMWRRTPRSIEAFGAQALFEGDVAALPVDTIHSVTNPLLRFTGGIHIYGGDFFETTRSQWDPETLNEKPSDGEAIRAMFRRENERALNTD